MFTGIIEEVGIVESIQKKNDLYKIKIRAKKVTDIGLGESIATNGVCLTVTNLGQDFFEADIMKATIDGTTLKEIKKGSFVNLERALPSNGRLNGHIVQGHVDGLGRIIKFVNLNNLVEYHISASKEILKYIVKKGSVTLNGISLTVSKVNADSFVVSIIPTTLKETTLTKLRTGDLINIETDIIGRYIERLFTPYRESEISMDLLKDF